MLEFQVPLKQLHFESLCGIFDTLCRPFLGTHMVKVIIQKYFQIKLLYVLSIFFSTPDPGHYLAQKYSSHRLLSVTRQDQ